MTEIPDLSIEPPALPSRRRKAPPEKKPDLPPAAEKAADLEALKKTVEDAASVSGGLWLSYLFALFYIAVAAGAVTHADLFLQRPVKLPFLGIELPLTAFFALAPILFLITHAYTLVHFVLLAAKAKRFHAQLKAQIKDENAPEAAVLREGLRGQLPSNIFVQFLAGPKELREGWFGRFLAFMAWVTLVVAPLALLLLLQLQFLPYHDASITWTHRVALVLDLALVWWLWRKILAGQTEIDEPRWRPSWSKALSIAATAAVIVFSWIIATFPGEWERQPLASVASIAPPALNKWRSVTNERMFNGAVDPITHRRVSWFSSTVVLPDFNLYQELKIDDPKKVEWRDTLFDARGRDLQGAALDFATLPRADFGGARLRGASLKDAQLQGALLNDARLQGASLDGAQLQGAWLDETQLQGASLQNAQLQGAWLRGARLQGAWLVGAQLQGASLDQAQLQGARLDHVQLQGASLQGAWLQGATLQFAQLQGAALNNAQLQGVRLAVADMTATNLNYAMVWRTEFTDAFNTNALVKNLSTSGLFWRPELWKVGINPSSNLFGSWTSPWTSAEYDALKREIEEVVPTGERRIEALRSIQRLDCARSELQSCDPNMPEPASVAAARQMIKQASVDDATYKKAVADELGELFCGEDGDAINILRGLLKNFQISGETGGFSLTLVELIMSKNCPVSALLTDDDKAKLHALKKAVAPPPVPQEPAPAPKTPASSPVPKK
jgi:uncharacterized protein YjbI with pentapeptide repeats